MTNYLVEDDHGAPVGMFDADVITDHGTKLAFALAAAGSKGECMTITSRVLADVGASAFGYVAACALQVMAAEILHPTLDVAAAAGADVRLGLVAIAEGRQP